MKNNDNQTLLERQRRIDAERKAQAILRAQHQRKQAAEAMAKVAGHKVEVSEPLPSGGREFDPVILSTTVTRVSEESA